MYPDYSCCTTLANKSPMTGKSSSIPTPGTAHIATPVLYLMRVIDKERPNASPLPIPTALNLMEDANTTNEITEVLMKWT